MVDLAHTLRRENPALLSRLEYHGIDIDHRALAAASALTTRHHLPSAHYHLGDALTGEGYPNVRFDVVISTGLGEFLSDEELAAFYGRVYDAMEPGATFYTSATVRDGRSDALLQMAEIVTASRTPAQLERILRHIPWRRLDVTRDPSGLQTFVTAVR
jgi:cyclopropane fatty-acyl-phospholipid synthase-like methyltransferase